MRMKALMGECGTGLSRVSPGCPDAPLCVGGFVPASSQPLEEPQEVALSILLFFAALRNVSPSHVQKFSIRGDCWGMICHG